MNDKAGVCSCCVIGALFLFAASGSWAADTLCTVIGSSTAVDTTIAVDSIFYEPAQDLVTAFETTTAGSGKTIRVCHNSTEHLLAEIKNGTALPPSAFPADPGFPRYGLFMAANVVAPNSLQASTHTIAYTYAYDTPVFFARRDTINTVQGLMNGLEGGTSATIPGIATSGQAINISNARMIAVADSKTDHNGRIAATILRDMGLLSRKWGGGTPSWMHNPLYSDSNLAYRSVTDGVNVSGFASKGQICRQINSGSVTYVEFTGAKYTSHQNAILLNSSNPIATALNNYIQGRIIDGTWNTFLADHCYGTF